MFLSRNKKNNVHPCKPQFYCIKVGFKGVNIIEACFRDAFQKCAIYEKKHIKINKCIFLYLNVFETNLDVCNAAEIHLIARNTKALRL